MTTDCINCPLRPRPAFVPFTAEDLAFQRRFKSGEMTVPPRGTILRQGAASAQLYTALAGWGLRYVLLPDGERQVINFVMPGDLIGLQAGVLGEMEHSVEAVTEMTLCVFDRADLWTLFRESPERAYDVTWLAAREEHFLGDTLATLGRRSGTERVAWGIVTIYRRARSRKLTQEGVMPMPFRQQDLADALGLSLVHTNKTLARLRARGLIDLGAGTILIRDLPTLEWIAKVDSEEDAPRPLI